jgi:hypothetical protein
MYFVSTLRVYVSHFLHTFSEYKVYFIPKKDKCKALKYLFLWSFLRCIKLWIISVVNQMSWKLKTRMSLFCVSDPSVVHLTQNMFETPNVQRHVRPAGMTIVGVEGGNWGQYVHFEDRHCRWHFVTEYPWQVCYIGMRSVLIISVDWKTFFIKLRLKTLFVDLFLTLETILGFLGK